MSNDLFVQIISVGLVITIIYLLKKTYTGYLSMEKIKRERLAVDAEHLLEEDLRNLQQFAQGICEEKSRVEKGELTHKIPQIISQDKCLGRVTDGITELLFQLGFLRKATVKDFENYLNAYGEDKKEGHLLDKDSYNVALKDFTLFPAFGAKSINVITYEGVKVTQFDGYSHNEVFHISDQQLVDTKGNFYTACGCWYFHKSRRGTEDRLNRLRELRKSYRIY